MNIDMVSLPEHTKKGKVDMKDKRQAHTKHCFEVEL
jgi:hypothetical protein